MAVHLNARLNTRLIPILFSAAIALLVASAAVHAHASGDATQDQIQTQFQEPLETQDIPREELREVMENAKPERVDRRPGFSPVTLAPARDESVAEASDSQPLIVEDQR